jgi:hypothetical protein
MVDKDNDEVYTTKPRSRVDGLLLKQHENAYTKENGCQAVYRQPDQYG